jgi:hypothetical protein
MMVSDSDEIGRIPNLMLDVGSVESVTDLTQ